MKELLKINYEAEQPTVSARDLHEALEIRERFSLWFSRYADVFEKGTDYQSVGKPTVVNNGAKRVLDDFLLSTDMAKHISMMTKTEKGKIMRQYFIDLEKAWNTPEQVMARALKLADRTIDTLKEENKKLIEDNERMKPKVIFADAVRASSSSILIGDLAKLLKQNGVDIGQKRLFDWMREKGYLIKRKGSDWNMPTQKAMDMKVFEVKESTVNNPDGSVRINRTTKVTGKGQTYFVNKFLDSRDNRDRDLEDVRV